MCTHQDILGSESDIHLDPRLEYNKRFIKVRHKNDDHSCMTSWCKKITSNQSP